MYRLDPTFNDFPLHNVVLPCNWLISPHKFTTEKDMKVSFVGMLLDAIGKVVEALRMEVDMGEFLHLSKICRYYD
jgi:hypothetical protein